MIIISYFSYYSRPTVRTKNSKDEVIRRYKEALARKNQLSLTTTTSTNSINIPYKTAFLLLCGGAIVVALGLIYSLGYKSGKAKYKYRNKS